MSISVTEPRLLHSINSRRASGGALMIVVVFMFTPGGWTFPMPSDAIQKGAAGGLVIDTDWPLLSMPEMCGPRSPAGVLDEVPRSVGPQSRFQPTH